MLQGFWIPLSYTVETGFNTSETIVNGKKTYDVSEITNYETITVNTFVTDMQPYGKGVVDGILGLSPCPPSLGESVSLMKYSFSQQLQ